MERKLKVLIKKFSFNSLVEECKKHGWELPTAYDISAARLDYRNVWVSDVPIRDIDKDDHAYVFNLISGNLLISNKNNLQHAVVFEEVS